MPENDQSIKIQEELWRKLTIAHHDKNKQSIAKLEECIEGLKEARNEERFFCILIVTIALDVVYLRDVANWATILLIGLLELIFLIILARKLGVEDLTNILDKYFQPLNPISRKQKKDNISPSK